MRFVGRSLCVCVQVATFIVQKILLDDLGLSYICATAERFYAVSKTLTPSLSWLGDLSDGCGGHLPHSLCWPSHPMPSVCVRVCVCHGHDVMCLI